MNFQYGVSEIGHIFAPFQIRHLRKMNIRASAREILTFITYFPLIAPNCFV